MNYESKTAKSTIIKSRDAIYFEDRFPYKSNINMMYSITFKLQIQELALRRKWTTRLLEPRSKRATVIRNFGEDFYIMLIDNTPLT